MILRRVSTFIALGLLVGGCENLPQFFDLSDEQVKTAAKEITVIIDDCGSAGSGVIFKKDGNTYSVLTADHVVKKAKGNCVILKSDNTRYKASVSEAIVPVAGVDLAVLTFQSDKNHKFAKLGDSDKATDYTKVYVAGAPEPSKAIPNRIIRVEDGKIDNRKLQTNGYDLIYTNKTLRGMSGGPVLNQKGEVIGIHGQGDQDNGIKTGLNLGIPINTYSKGIKTGLNLGIPINTYSAALYVGWGNSKYTQGKYKEAIEDYNKAIDLNRNYAEAYFVRGCANFYINKKEQAIADIDQAIKLYEAMISDQAIKINRLYGDAYRVRGHSKYDLGQTKEAIVDYDQAIKLYEAMISDQAIKMNVGYASAYTGRGSSKYDLGQKKEAIADYEKAAELYKQQGKTSDYQNTVIKIKILSAQ